MKAFIIIFFFIKGRRAFSFLLALLQSTPKYLFIFLEMKLLPLPFQKFQSTKNGIKLIRGEVLMFIFPRKLITSVF